MNNPPLYGVIRALLDYRKKEEEDEPSYYSRRTRLVEIVEQMDRLGMFREQDNESVFDVSNLTAERIIVARQDSWPIGMPLGDTQLPARVQHIQW
jgi:hypothetical protein